MSWLMDPRDIDMPEFGGHEGSCNTAITGSDDYQLRCCRPQTVYYRLWRRGGGLGIELNAPPVEFGIVLMRALPSRIAPLARKRPIGRNLTCASTH